MIDNELDRLLTCHSRAVESKSPCICSLNQKCSNVIHQFGGRIGVGLEEGDADHDRKYQHDGSSGRKI